MNPTIPNTARGGTRAATCLLATLTGLAGLAAPAPAAADPIVLAHGKIFTGDPARPWAQALAIDGDTITAVGSDAEVAELAPEHARVIDLGGRTVVPGLNDAHVHVVVPEGAYLNAPTFIPGPGPSAAAVVDLLAGGAAATPPGTWLYAFVGSAVAEDAAVERALLDSVTPDHPVALFAWWGHGIWLNSRALQVLGIAVDQPDPFGGSWVRYPGTDIITGEAHEYAEFAVRRGLLALVPDSHLAAQYQAFAAGAVRLGVTSLQDMAVGLPHGRALAAIRAAALPLRVRSMCVPLTPEEACAHEPAAPRGARVTSGGVKWISDGTPIERLAFLDGTYADRPGWSGSYNLDGRLDEILADVLTRSASTHQLLVHAVGDGAIAELLAAMERVPGAARWRHRRTRLEHGDLLFAPDFGRARDLGVVVVQNPTHFALAALFAQRLDGATFAAMEPMRSLLAAGIPLALGSDAIGAPGNPFVDLMLAIIHPTHPSEGLTIEEGVRAYTRGSAYAELAEHHKGTLAPGRLADVAVLTQDVFTAPPFALPATASVLTIVGGQVVWDAGVL